MQPWAEELYRQRKKDFGKDSMETKCLPFGPAYTTTPYRDHTIVQTPAVIVILNGDLTYRQFSWTADNWRRTPSDLDGLLGGALG